MMSEYQRFEGPGRDSAVVKQADGGSTELAQAWKQRGNECVPVGPLTYFNKKSEGRLCVMNSVPSIKWTEAAPRRRCPR